MYTSKIVAIDFETANSSPVSAISLGIVVYEDGEITNEEVIYFCPPLEYQNVIFTHIHHMTFEDVADEPPFDYYYSKLIEYFRDAVLVAHNTRFDIGVLNACCDYFGLARLTNPYIDTVKIARRVYPQLPNHRLNTVSKHLGISLNHHEALSDAYACMMILLNAMEEVGTYDLDAFLATIHLSYQH